MVHLTLEKGNLFAFGNNIYSQLGDQPQAFINSNPIEIEYFKNIKISQIRCGSEYSFVLSGNLLLLTKENNKIYFFGKNEHSVLGKKRDSIENIPIEVDLSPLLQIDNIYAGENHNALVTKDGKLLLWGWNTNGELGIETQEKCDPNELLQFRCRIFLASSRIGDYIYHNNRFTKQFDLCLIWK